MIWRAVVLSAPSEQMFNLTSLRSRCPNTAAQEMKAQVIVACSSFFNLYKWDSCELQLFIILLSIRRDQKIQPRTRRFSRNRLSSLVSEDTTITGLQNLLRSLHPPSIRLAEVSLPLPHFYSQQHGCP